MSTTSPQSAVSSSSAQSMQITGQRATKAKIKASGDKRRAVARREKAMPRKRRPKVQTKAEAGDEAKQGDAEVATSMEIGSSKAEEKSKAKASKPGSTESHPNYPKMVRNAIASLNDSKGSSRQAILRYILSTYKVQGSPKRTNAYIRLALRSGVESGAFKQIKGSFRLAPQSKAPKPKKNVKHRRSSQASMSPQKVIRERTSPVRPRSKTISKAAAKSPKTKKTVMTTCLTRPVKKPLAKEAAKRKSPKSKPGRGKPKLGVAASANEQRKK